jgi:hypothetical protein
VLGEAVDGNKQPKFPENHESNIYLSTAGVIDDE